MGFLTMFGEKLKGADPEDVIVSAFKVLDPEGTGFVKKDFIEELLTTQCDRFSADEMTNLWAAFPPDVAGNVDYKNICYVSPSPSLSSHPAHCEGLVSLVEDQSESRWRSRGCRCTSYRQGNQHQIISFVSNNLYQIK